ncbi:hypothetical protein [Actinoalloteichus hymeniacidonis]|uniref:hypothetical protein n=1 Tax=Actinoalloteichus hymeniacidonis TaxID=340345 RepID=UPI0012F786E2|nr:hypothetical protein [Actinoalloteichus hymeniacidonis]MBB5907282.1 hypothetical protein [Actinoalloteichus hymeniacidonis]
MELCKRFADDVESLRRFDDAHLYHQITFAASLRHSRDEFLPHLAPDLDAVADVVLGRMSTGWFAQPTPGTPQSRFSKTGEFGPIGSLASHLGAEISEKPAGGAWTSSYLPSGESAWARWEQAEFSHESRDPWSVHFDASSCALYQIDSLDDFTRLVLRYPGDTQNGRVGIDWSTVAADFHAVHLTAKGLLTVQNFPVSTPLGIAELRGWDAESTVWLRVPPGLRVTPAND